MFSRLCKAAQEYIQRGNASSVNRSDARALVTRKSVPSYARKQRVTEKGENLEEGEQAIAVQTMLPVPNPDIVDESTVYLGTAEAVRVLGILTDIEDADGVGSRYALDSAVLYHQLVGGTFREEYPRERRRCAVCDFVIGDGVAEPAVVLFQEKFDTDKVYHPTEGRRERVCIHEGCVPTLRKELDSLLNDNVGILLGEEL